MDRVVIPIFYFLIIWRMKPAPINWQYLELSFLDCQSANQASQMNGVFIHQFKLEKLKLIAYQTRIHEPLNTTWSWNEDFSKLPATMIYRWYVRVTDIIFLMTIFGIGWQNLDPGDIFPMLVADSVCRTDHIIWITLSPTSTVANSRHQHRCKINQEFLFLKTKLWKIRIWRMLYLHLLRHQLIMNLFNIRLAQTRIIVSITLKDYKKLLVDISPNSCENTL